MKKHLIDFRITDNIGLSPSCNLITLESVSGNIPDIQPGQFVNIRISDSSTTFLRRPISVAFSDNTTIQLIVRKAGDGTRKLCSSEVGSIFNILLPLGRGFSLPQEKKDRILLIGGGVGIAPIYSLGRLLQSEGYKPEFLIGARNVEELLFLERLEKIGNVSVCTDDGSAGLKGFVVSHPVLKENWQRVYVCGPLPMMKAVGQDFYKSKTICEVSLENMMACGLGACLCCVEDTVRGNECVCTKGPVYNINDLRWYN